MGYPHVSASSPASTIAACAWASVLFLLLGFAASAGQTATVDKIVPAIAEKVALGDVGGAVRAIEQTYPLESPLGALALHELSLRVLHRGLRERDAYDRYFAATSLAGYGDWSGVGAVEEGLASMDPGLRMAAIDGLALIGHGRALDLLVASYWKSDDFGRLLVLQGLRAVRDPRAFAALADAVRVSEARLRLQAVEDLGLLGDERANPRLRELLVSDAAPFERTAVAHALLRLGDGAVLPLLLDAVRGGEPTYVRAAATLALGDARADAVLPTLRGALADREPDVSLAAAAALTRHGVSDGLASIERALNDADLVTRLNLARLLERIECRMAGGVVRTALDSPDPDLTMAAMRVAVACGDVETMGRLIGMLRSLRDPILRAAVAWALGRLGDESAVRPLASIITEEEPAVRYAAADGLARLAGRLTVQGKSGPPKGVSDAPPSETENRR